MGEMQSDLARVHVRETEAELVVEVEVPLEVELSRLDVSLREGVLTITLPRRAQRSGHIPGFHPEASGV
jgi:HSP20 family molecular chaperone IbpA